MAYTKRYAGGFLDFPNVTTPIDSSMLNAVETALVELLSTDGSVDGQVLQWIQASSKFGPALLLNKNVDPSAAIVKSKLDFSGANGIVNADVAGAAAIARSKLDFGAGLVNADISAAAAIVSSKFADPVVRGLYRKTTAKAVNTTVAATDLLNGEITIGAGVMGATGAVKLTAWGDRLQNSGGTAALPRFQVVFGGATLIDTGTPGGLESASAVRAQWFFEAVILNSASNAQVVGASLSVGSLGGIAAGTAAFTTGTGTYQSLSTSTTSVMAQASGVGTGAVDTTAGCALLLKAINGSANAAYETKLLGAFVEVL